MNKPNEGRLPIIVVIIPAFNEADSIAKVMAEIPQYLVTEVVVVDNNSTDGTAEKAHQAGATVVSEPRRGYGYACWRGVEYCRSRPVKPDIIVFLDGDHSDYPEEMADIVKPIIDEEYDLVLGSRTLGKAEAGAMTLPQVFGNRLARILIRLLYRVRFTDLGPFRAIKYDALLALDMRDRTYGWTVEMQLKAIKHGLRIREVPVSYRPRIGKSKISGTIKGTVMAGYRILATIVKYA